MKYMLCKHKVEDFEKWYSVFRTHAKAQRDAGLEILHILREAFDPDLVVMWFRVEDVEKAIAFTETPDAYQAAEDSGVIGVPEMLFLEG